MQRKEESEVDASDAGVDKNAGIFMTSC